MIKIFNFILRLFGYEYTKIKLVEHININSADICMNGIAMTGMGKVKEKYQIIKFLKIEAFEVKE